MRHQGDSERRAANRIGLIQKLEELRFNICVTSKASRNQADTADKYRYRLSTADAIMIQPTSECIHKDNSFFGRESHPNSIHRLLHVFAGLEEVRFYLRHPSFLEDSQQHNPYPYCNENKIGEALTIFLSLLSQRLDLTPEEKTVSEEVVFRALSEMMLGTKEHSLSGFYDRCLNETCLSEGICDS